MREEIVDIPSIKKILNFPDRDNCLEQMQCDAVQALHLLLQGAGVDDGVFGNKSSSRINDKFASGWVQFDIHSECPVL